MPPSLSASPSTSLSPASSATATSAVFESAKQLAWQPAVYLVVVLVLVGIVASVVWLIWNDPCIPSTRRGKMEAVETDSALHFPSASALVQRMLRYFFTTLWPAVLHLRQTTAISVGSVSGGTASRLQPALPLFAPTEFREPYVAAPRPIMARDTSSFRVQSNPYSGSEPSSWPVASPYSVPVLPGSAPSSNPS